MIYYLSTNGIGISAHDPPALFFSLLLSEYRSSHRNDFPTAPASRKEPSQSVSSQNAWIENGFTLDPDALPRACRMLVAFASELSWNAAKSVRKGHGPSPSAIFLPLYGSIGGLGEIYL